MDPAVIGKMRIGYFRIGVKRPDWDNTILPKMKSVSAKSMGGIDPCLAGEFRAGHVRAGVYIPLFDAVKERLEKVT